MDTPLETPPKSNAELRQHLAEQQALLAHNEQALKDQAQTIERQRAHIQSLEEALIRLRQQHFGPRSEKLTAEQLDLQLFNEAELLDAPSPSADDEVEVEVAAHKRKVKKTHALPKDLPRIEVVHDLPEDEKTCACCGELHPIGEQRLEQLAVIPLQYFVIVHVRKKYASTCRHVLRTAPMPAQPLPASQASPQLLAQVMVAKYHDGLPLYRQEQMAAREGLVLPREKLARWLIQASSLFQPLLNLLQDTFFSYDIAHADETSIQVLKETGRRPQNLSYLWIRRGGPPGQPVVLVDYDSSRSGQTAHGLLETFSGYLICDGYAGYSPTIQAQGLLPVFCNDHSRRKFVDVIKTLTQGSAHPERAKHWVASQAIKYYKKLYKIEKEIKKLTPEQKYRARQARAVPIWETFLKWAQKTLDDGVLHQGTREALQYLLNHKEGLRRYCDDGRLPISNIRAEHTAKKIAVARKNFLFADTPAGAEASSRIYGILETARANGHHVHRYLTVLLTELPNISSVDDVEALLPWNMTPEDVNRRFATYPSL